MRLAAVSKYRADAAINIVFSMLSAAALTGRSDL